MNMDLARIVRFTNITDEDFTHSYHASPYTVKAHETLLFPYDLGRLLAKHLARKILFAGLSRDRLSVDRAAFSGEDENSLIAKIMHDEANRPVSPQLSEAQIIRNRVDELNANPPEGANASAVSAGRTKADVIAEMEKLGLPVDKRSSMAKLEETLAAAKKVA
jgi:hypothetical protein